MTRATAAYFLSIVVALTASANAAAIQMITTNAQGQSWNTATAWENNQAPSSLHDYVVGKKTDGTMFGVRTPTAAGPHTFGGNSLTLEGGSLNLNVTFNNTSDNDLSKRTSIISDFRMTNGGTIVNAVNPVGGTPYPGTAQVLAGELHFSNGSSNYNVIRTAGNATTGNIRDITLTAKMTGNGTVRLLQRGTITLNNTDGASGSSASDFSGTWHVGGINVTVGSGSGTGAEEISNTSTIRTTLAAASVGSLGVDSSVVLDLWSTFNLAYDWVTSGSLTLKSNGGNATAIRMNLDNSIIVGALIIDGVEFAPGTYNYSQLSAAGVGFGNYFTGTLGGSITVRPPAAGTLIELSAVDRGGDTRIAKVCAMHQASNR